MNTPRDKEVFEGNDDLFNDSIQQVNSAPNSPRFSSKPLPVANSDQNQRLIHALESLTEQFKRHNDLALIKFIAAEQDEQDEAAAIEKEKEEFNRTGRFIYRQPIYKGSSYLCGGGTLLQQSLTLRR